MNKAPHADRLGDQIKALREKARQLPAGTERDELLHEVKQDEIALRVIRWLTSKGHLPPPSDCDPGDAASIAPEVTRVKTRMRDFCLIR